MLKTCPLVENICIYGDSSKSYMVSLVVPARPALSLMAERFKSGLNFEQLCEDGSEEAELEAEVLGLEGRGQTYSN